MKFICDVCDANNIYRAITTEDTWNCKYCMGVNKVVVKKESKPKKLKYIAPTHSKYKKELEDLDNLTNTLEEKNDK